MKLKRATFRHIEAEIYAYYDTLREIETRRADIILTGREEPWPVASGDGQATSQVERRATKLADSILLREMERITKAIADTYERTREEARKIIWVKYGLAIDWQPPEHLVGRMQEKERQGKSRFDMSPDEMAEVLAVDRTTFHRYRSGFVYGIAERLGWY